MDEPFGDLLSDAAGASNIKAKVPAINVVEREKYEQLTKAVVEKSMEKYRSDLMKVLGSLDERLGGLERCTETLARSVGDLHKQSQASRSDASEQLGLLEHTSTDIARKLKLLQEKMELAEAQKDFEKIHVSDPPTSATSTDALVTSSPPLPATTSSATPTSTPTPTSVSAPTPAPAPAPAPAPQPPPPQPSQPQAPMSQAPQMGLPLGPYPGAPQTGQPQGMGPQYAPPQGMGLGMGMGMGPPHLGMPPQQQQQQLPPPPPQYQAPPQQGYAPPPQHYGPPPSSHHQDMQYQQGPQGGGGGAGMGVPYTPQSGTYGRPGGGGGGGGGTDRHLEKIVQDVAKMGFHPDQVRQVIQRIASSGQTVDMNVVLDQLMR
mmetsp:Transcript_20277/g.28074  ORF Transcript_20277/g.28074 Transcript_20277/m.28074 type:complete len:375 (+) Transcript_20277:212-1336(+)|eukprot:CAMPEP_0196598638 /NCGR_PEP_ID=MMETSP1081-20130531/94431_1 /TAXON_ID=36882 /ORGANISM="Pyramimonas amylifera, Strain CCMP720" /LENGTH=374 /DNA_ID=CAMNT_0041924355 /DNA_START=585 /DNA_END=1709 /DNA_ORIENTATION=-